MSDGLERKIGYQRAMEIVENSGIKGSKSISKLLFKHRHNLHELSELEMELLNKNESLRDQLKARDEDVQRLQKMWDDARAKLDIANEGYRLKSEAFDMAKQACEQLIREKEIAVKALELHRRAWKKLMDYVEDNRKLAHHEAADTYRGHDSNTQLALGKEGPYINVQNYIEMLKGLIHEADAGLVQISERSE